MDLKTCIHYRQKPKDEWIVIENAHEAIISEELFNIAQEILDNNKEKSEFKITRHDMKRDPVNKYKGVIFDANTNLLLIRNGVRSNKKIQSFTIISSQMKKIMVFYLKLLIFL